MAVSRWFYWLFVSSLIVLFLVLGWGIRVLYTSEVKHVQEKMEELVQKSAARIQENNVTLNNLAKAYTDTDYKQKTAFAIGMTKNMGKMSIYFDDSTPAPVSKAKPEKDTVLHIDRAYIKRERIEFKPLAVKTIDTFNTLFNATLKKEKLAVPYSIQKVEKRPIPKVHLASDFFIINFFDPVVYRIVYEIPASLIWKRLLPYLGICLLLLGLISGALLLFYRSYRLQLQMAQFKESLFSNFTHELKTPLASLQLVLAAIRKENDSVRISQADTELNRMKVLIEKILSFGRLNEEEFLLDKEVVNINALVQEAIELMKVSAANTEAEIRFNPCDNPEVLGDKMLLLNLVAGMIDNALKYRNGKPLITVSTSEEKKEVKISIADNGIGIAPRYHKKIFDPFFRVPGGDVHNVKGHGLGLSFAQEVVKLHKGKIALESSAGSGSVFIIKLPAL